MTTATPACLSLRFKSYWALLLTLRYLSYVPQELLMDADMRPTQRLVLACQQAAQLLEEALEATKRFKKETN
ncbi:hypothetical protein Taro_038746 [Colocasia esculenta]|uniref:Uncharacterized protein n=1 Tax=Colocasia esculenta TaxID=4460 RepID=A0A843WGR2_COLES|nr:hypothetical protein [Colocasia esculenta]